MSPYSSELLVDLNVDLNNLCLQLFRDCCHYFSKKATFSFHSCLRSVISMPALSLFLLVILTFAEWPVIQARHPLCTAETGAGVEMEDTNIWNNEREELRGGEGGCLFPDRWPLEAGKTAFAFSSPWVTLSVTTSTFLNSKRNGC